MTHSWEISSYNPEQYRSHPDKFRKFLENFREVPFVFGHAGDGNLHPKIMYDYDDPEQVRQVHEAFTEIFKLTCRLGGTISGEHGIGLAKAPYMPLEHDPVALSVMQGIKNLLDPQNILNPGKMGFADGSFGGCCDN